MTFLHLSTGLVLTAVASAVAWPKEACDIPIAVADLRVANVTEIPLILNDTFSMVTLIKGKVDELSKMKGGTEVQSFVLTLGLLFVEVTVPTQAPRAKLTVLAAGTALAVFANRLSWWGGRGLMKLDLWVGELPQATILAGAVPYLWDGVPPDEGVAAPIGTEKLKRYARDLGFQH